MILLFREFEGSSCLDVFNAFVFDDFQLEKASGSQKVNAIIVDMLKLSLEFGYLIAVKFLSLYMHEEEEFSVALCSQSVN